MIDSLLFDEVDLKQIFGNELMKKAKRLLLKDVVSNVKVLKKSLKGEFETSKETHKLIYKPNAISKSTCTCRGDEKKLCVHLATLCLYYLESVSVRKSKTTIGLEIQTMHEKPTMDDTVFFDPIEGIDCLKNSLGIGVAFTGSKKQFSLFLCHKTQKKILSDAFFVLYPFKQLLVFLDPRLAKLLSTLFERETVSFFMPETYYNVSQHETLLTFLFTNYTIYSQELTPYRKQKKELVPVLSFVPTRYGITLRCKWRIDGSDKTVLFSSFLILQDQNPICIQKGKLYHLKQPSLMKMALSFYNAQRLLFDLEKFKLFCDKKVPVLRKQGFLVEISPAISKLKIMEGVPYLCAHFHKSNDRLWVYLSYQYGLEKVSVFSKQRMVIDVPSGHVYKRSLLDEESLLKHFLAFKPKVRRRLYYLESQALYAFITACQKENSRIHLSNPSVLSRFQVQEQDLVPQLSIKGSDTVGKFNFELEFDGKELSNLSISEMIRKLKKGDRFYRDASGQVYKVNGLETLDVLVLRDEWGEHGVSKSISLGESIFIISELNQCLSISDDIKKKVLELIKPSDKLKAACPMIKRLHDYQKRGVNWLLSLYRQGFCGLLADDMGLGKTVQTLCFLSYLKSEAISHPQEKKGKAQKKNPHLIIAPKSLLFNWRLEIESKTPELSVLVYDGRKRADLLPSIDDYDIILTSYHIARLDVDKLRKTHFDTIVLDEAQNIKNPRSKVTKSLKEIPSSFKLCLSGTPMENNLGELWSLMDFLMPGYFGSLETFKNTYIRPIEQGDHQRKEQLRINLLPLMLRRLKEEVAKDLPAKTVQNLFCEFQPDQQKFYASILEDEIEDLKSRITEKGFDKSRFHILSLLTRLRQVCCHPSLVDNSLEMESIKMNVLLSRLEQLANLDHKVVVFSQFVSMIDLIRKELSEKEIPFEVLTGKTRKRQEAVESFQNNPEIKIFLVSLKAGGVGLNLNSADYVFIYDPWWNPAVEKQAMDRVHRIGQKKSVFVYRLLVKDTIEEIIHMVQNEKAELTETLFLKEGELISLLNKTTLKNLFDT